MKPRLALLFVAAALGSATMFSVSGCSGQKQTPDGSGEEAKRKARQAAPDKADEKKTDEKKTDEKKADEKKADEKKADEPKPAPAAAADFRLPDDPGGRLALRVLAPPETLPSGRQTAPKSKPSPRGIDNPWVPLPPQIASLPRLNENGPRRPLLPQMIAPEPLFGHEDSFGALPQSLSFPAMDRAKLVTPDVGLPVSLPRMAQPVLEKTVVADPTLDESKTAILSASLPPRESQSPFQRLTLPDPFENQETGKLAGTPLPEVLPDGTIPPPR